MFTGIIEGVGKICSKKMTDRCFEVEVECDFDLENTNVGDSISVNGCCLTVTSRLGRHFWADLSNETLEATTFENIKLGDPVNLERALKVGSRLGGHIVQGHIDTTAKISDIIDKNTYISLIIEIPDSHKRYIVEKGSVAVDGVSLTVGQISNDCFMVNIIPHTKVKTTFFNAKKGQLVNLEVDILGKYVEKLQFLDSEELKKDSKITKEFLEKHGFLNN